CGAGGLSSAVGEMGRELGARVYLDRVPLKYRGLTYTEIWISESQERMVFSVPKNSIARLLEVFNRENVETTIIGEFTGSKRLKLYYKENLVCDLDMKFLHEGIPQDEKIAVYTPAQNKEPNISSAKDLTKNLLRLLSDYDICSKEWIIRQYDHEVQGGSVIKPLMGVNNDGPADCAVVKPILDSPKGVAVSCGINFRLGLVDPYWMAASCIDEALRQIICVGGSLEQTALLDNFCWGNPSKPDRLGSLVRCAYACYDIAKAYGVPFISGKDSLNNEYTIKGESISIPGTLLVSAISVIEDTAKCVSGYAKQEGDLVYIVGMTYNELGGSHYYKLFNALGNCCPKVYPAVAKKVFQALNKAVRCGYIRAMHDCSEGGLGVAAAELCFAGGLGMNLSLSGVPYVDTPCISRLAPVKREDLILFSESNSRFIVEIERKNRKAFEKMLKGLPFGLLGCVSSKGIFQVQGLDGRVCIREDINVLKESWLKPLRW
ncbi:MAG: phosphoribosylformylglycinamidine synthase, partial [Candidatus Omnitrophica bacterium]|nr:phosphoribosylformylglycinamidine synthase [Candidatus Omnitrophota bacterium]